MPHQHLSFHGCNGLQCNADHDDNRCTADGQVRDLQNVTHNNGQKGNDAQIQRTKERDLVDHLADEIRCRLTRTAAVLLQVVGDLHRVVLNCRIEIGECDDQQEIADGVDHAARAEQVLIPAVAAGHTAEHGDRCRQGCD